MNQRELSPLKVMTQQEKVPLERLLFPTDIDGSQGYNRAAPNVTMQIEAVDDLDAIKAWLAESRNTPHIPRSRRDLHAS